MIQRFQCSRTQVRFPVRTVVSLFVLLGTAMIPTNQVIAYHIRPVRSSSFTGTAIPTPTIKGRSKWSMYTNNEAADHNAWTVLSHTEEWISNTLHRANSNNPNNPYARKEVSYVCENQSSSAMVISNLFKWLRDARKQGEAHGDAEVERHAKLGTKDNLSDPCQNSIVFIFPGDSYSPMTLRQTQVVVIPSNPALDNFFVFDDLIQAINQARRNARDFVTYRDQDNEDEWSIAINCAHMHPRFGERTAQQKLEDLKREDEAGEVDVNLEAYKKAKLAARRSPYPSIVIEVRSTPSPDFGSSATTSSNNAAGGSEGVSSEDVQKLEALFGKSAAIDKEGDGETSFWDQIGSQIQEVSSVTPTKLAQEWISHNLNVEEAACTESSTSQVDSAFQFVFANIAMMQEKQDVPHFLVLSNFLSTAATSFEKFTFSVSEILDTIPELRQRILLSTYHPEHIDPARRSPTPILSLSWKK